MTPLISWIVILNIIYSVWIMYYAYTRRKALSGREDKLDSYAADLSGWDIKQGSRRIALVNFLALCDTLAKLDPVLKEKLEVFKDAEGFYVVPKDEYVEAKFDVEE